MTEEIKAPISGAAISRWRFSRRPSLLLVLTLLTTALVLLPLVVILAHVYNSDSSVWQHLSQTVLPEYLKNSLLLALGVSVGVLVIGVPAAWMSTMVEFPGRKFLSWALLLPMAFPAYIIAYTYTGLLDFAGPVQTLFRQWTGLSYGEYQFFEIRSLMGATLMLSLVLYPYVYLMARAAFLEQSASSLEVGRTLGLNEWQALFRLSLPMARPAIITGLSLAIMETLADYGTVQYFGITTFTTGIFRTFYGFGDTAAAAQLSAILLAFVALLVFVERYSRLKTRYFSSAGHRPAARIVLKGPRAWLCSLLSALPVLLGFVLPGLVLLYWSVQSSEVANLEFWLLAWNSLKLAFIAAFIAVMLALILAYTQRLRGSRFTTLAVNTAGLGYALPGTMIAVGIMIPLAWADFKLNDLTSAVFDWEPGLILSGSLVALLFAYSVRFLAVSLGSIQSGLSKIKPSIDQSARSLGYKPSQLLRVIHIPLLKSSVLTALLIVFVDVLKELPATLMLRPFNFNTLAVRAYELASDERLVDAAPASIMIVAVGLIPVLLLSRSIDQRKSDR